jgi:hypothetical protein
MVGLLGRVISPLQGLYLHRITQHRKTRTNIHDLSGIRTHDPRNQPAKTHASDRTATVTDIYYYYCYYYPTVVLHSKTFLLYSSNFSGLAAHYKPDRSIRHCFTAFYSKQEIAGLIKTENHRSATQNRL